MAYGDVGHPTRRSRRWGRRLLATTLVLLVVFGVLLVVADRVGANLAEERIATEVSQELDARGVSSSAPNVTVGGFPFLTQVLAEKYTSITILLRDVSTDASQENIRLPRLDVEARDVNAPLDTLRGGQGDIVAKTVEGTATVGYASVADLMDQPNLKLAERAGRLVVTFPVQLLGQEYILTGPADIVAADGKIRLRFKELDAEGLPDTDQVRQALNQYAGELSIDVPLPPLPFGIQVREVRALPEGLAVTAEARDVPLNKAMA